MQKHWVQEERFVVEGDTHCRGGAQRALRFGEEHRLFASVAFVLRGTYGGGGLPSKEQLQRLIEAGGGVIRDDARNRQQLVLVGALEADDAVFVSQLREEFNVYPLRAQWLLDAISRYSIEDQDLYDENVLGFGQEGEEIEELSFSSSSS